MALRPLAWWFVVMLSGLFTRSVRHVNSSTVAGHQLGTSGQVLTDIHLVGITCGHGHITVSCAVSNSPAGRGPTGPDHAGRRVKLAAGVLLVIAGTIWILQGLDVAFAPESFMTDNRMWVLWGSVAVASGIVMLWWSRRSD